jgi:hypothetical protein
MRSWAAVGAASLGSAITILSCGSRTSLLPVTGTGSGGEPEDSASDVFGASDATGESLPEAGVDVSMAPDHDASGPTDSQAEKPPPCPDPLIYLATLYGELWSFNPKTNTFADIAALACPTGSTLFALAADRRGTAYAVYYSGELFALDMTSGACHPTKFVATHGPNFLQFGMGFVANGGDGGGGGPDEPETLYVSSIGTPTRLGIIDTKAFSLTALAQIGPESLTGVALSGTGDGRLFGYYNQPSPGDLIQLDPATSQVLQDWPVGLTQGQAWGFAFWKEKFYLFTTADNYRSRVHLFDPATSALTFVTDAKQLGSIIISATVSTCAPLR